MSGNLKSPTGSPRPVDLTYCDREHIPSSIQPRSLESGCDAHLVKPVSLVDLNEVLISFSKNSVTKPTGVV
ncbi:MAG TPA: hypothetical protein VGM98_02100 [Schlesneria sp.]|jgi:hypothetical protein